MHSSGRGRRTLGAWLLVYALAALCAVLGILQYRAIAEVSIAARERLRSSLEASLFAASQDFDSTISSAAAALVPAAPQDARAVRDTVAELYARGGPTARYRRLFARIALAVPQAQSLSLLEFEPETGAWKSAPWPEEWSGFRNRFETIERRGPQEARDATEPPARNPVPAFEIPLFAAQPNPFPRRGGPAPPGARREVGWMILEVSVPYLRDTLLPEVLQRHLGQDYQAEVIARDASRNIIYRSDADLPDISQTADASISILDLQGQPGPWRSGTPGRRGGPGSPGGPPPRNGRGPLPDQGRWMLYVRHRAGSLEAVVAQARWRSMAVTAGVLFLLAATLAALYRYTRRAQRLADLQMEFVAGVSHELRTPLTVIHTAAYNLRGNLAANPAQVERYGTLIQRESGRLKELVEQVLQFAGAGAGRLIGDRQALAVEPLLEEAIGAAKTAMDSAGCVVEKRVEPNLPAVMGDPVALRQALQNLLANAAKYGAGTSRWIGLSASLAPAVERRRGNPPGPAIEIRVADRGPGIPAGEHKQIFDPFYRGARAVGNQVHGAGLGLTLVKKIVEAHGGSITVRSEPTKGAEFIIVLPAAPPGDAG